MICTDTSLVIAALASWHPANEPARLALRGNRTAIGHCLLETYSVLTRLPEPERVPADQVATALDALFDRAITLPPHQLIRLPSKLGEVRVAGGATYDGLIGETARHHGATLLTLDARAAATYRALGVRFELLDDVG